MRLGRQGDTATLTFEGTSIAVFGTVGNEGQGRLNFSVDDGTPGFFGISATSRSEVTHNTRFWISPLLEETEHTLTVTVDSNSNVSLFLDYFVYTTTSTAGKALLVDDSDGFVTYSAGWQARNDSDTSLERTEHVSEVVGSWAALSFQGTGISLFGSSVGQGTTASVIIDESQPVVISQSQTNQLFNSSSLSSGTHTMNITIIGANALGIDYFLIQPDAENPVTVPAASPSAGGTTRLSKKPPTAAIAGGVVGGLVLFVLGLAIIFMLLRRRRRRMTPLLEQYIIGSNSTVPGAPRARWATLGDNASASVSQPNFGGGTEPPPCIHPEICTWFTPVIEWFNLLLNVVFVSHDLRGKIARYKRLRTCPRFISPGRVKNLYTTNVDKTLRSYQYRLVSLDVAGSTVVREVRPILD
ncbi:hypothetical protein MSAN_01132800 [Mycena sanguinolenta]|uniref:Uncharacterized protein n=1 Tax=Mycena sanguinolenta TaxID=230812 RepID=A0A8H6YNC0_9AGAR|nr:hypothetical protein MSAN_01132800 [Mycena sanguinolenta]